MVETDDLGATPSGQHGTGDCYLATTSAFAASTIDGNSFVFQMSGENGSGNSKADLGRYAASSGSITGGVIDEANISDTSVTTTTLTGGSYTTPDATNGRSTLSFTATEGTATFEVYVIDANRMFMIETDEAKAQSGEVRKQLNTSTYTAANVTGPYVSYAQGVEYSNGSLSGYDSSISQMTGNGAGVFTINQGYTDEEGTYQVGKENSGTMTVNFDSSNPGRATLTGGFPDTIIVYMFDTGSGFSIDFDTKVKSGDTLNYLQTGWMEPQTQTTFTNAAVAGNYLFGQLPRVEPTTNGNVGEFYLSNSGGFTASVTTAGEGDFTWDQSMTGGTYSWDTTATGTGSFLTGGNLSGISCVVINPTKAACIFNTDDSPSVEILQQ